MTPRELDERGWKYDGHTIAAPCGCVATGPFSYKPPEPGVFTYYGPDMGHLTWNGAFKDCGKTYGCVFQSFSRFSHSEIPKDCDLWEWMHGTVGMFA